MGKVAHLPMERGKAARRESKGGNQRQGNGELWKKGSLVLFIEVMTQTHTAGIVPHCPVLSISTVRLLVKQEIKSSFRNLIR